MSYRRRNNQQIKKMRPLCPLRGNRKLKIKSLPIKFPSNGGISCINGGGSDLSNLFFVELTSCICIVPYDNQN